MTGANMITTTTLSISIETKPASIPIDVTKNATFPLDAFSIRADKKSGTPERPKYPDMIQILSRMKMTFQSTILKASISEYTPRNTINKMPNNAAMTLSIQPVMTRMMLARNTTLAAICMNSIHRTPFFK